MRKPGGRAWRAVAVGAAVAGTAGCFPVTRTTSPAIDGEYTLSDGTPVAGAHVALSTGRDDRRCARARTRVVTDAAGRFTIPATHRREIAFLLLPLEHVAVYNVCAGREAAFDTTAHESLHALPVPDRIWLDCVEAAAPEAGGGTRVACVLGRRPDEDEPA